MPLKLNVGVSRKVGLPDYGSAGASCNLELELDGGLLEKDLDSFQRRVRAAYSVAQRAVSEELTRATAPRNTTNRRVQSGPTMPDRSSSNGASIACFQSSLDLGCVSDPTRPTCHAQPGAGHRADRATSG